MKTKYHRDKTVTIWNCLAQRWERTSSPSEEVLATFSSEERAEIIRHIEKAERGDA